MLLKKRMWEYKIIVIWARDRVHVEKHLNALGELGWELVSVIHDSERDADLLYLKRETTREV